VGKLFNGIDGKLADWLAAQPMFFVATAPLDADGLINCSPKGLRGTFAVLDEHRVGYLDLTGSGVETLAHLRNNGRIVVMFCAFDGWPRIVRLHGRGRAVLPGDDDFDVLLPRFSEHPGVRSIIVVDVRRVADSCGYAVPRLDYVEDRDLLDLSAVKRGPAKLAAYRREHNELSLDGIPAVSGNPRPHSSAGRGTPHASSPGDVPRDSWPANGGRDGTGSALRREPASDRRTQSPGRFRGPAGTHRDPRRADRGRPRQCG
jgi:hypothetical protein